MTDTFDPKKPAPLACRILNDIEPRDNVKDVIDGMLEWYNGFEFLWRAGGWTDDTDIPEEYQSAFDMPRRMARLAALHGEHSYTAEHPEIVVTACIMQVARWFSGYDYRGVHKWDHNSVYWNTARAMCRSLGYDVYETTDWPDRVIGYNDAPGRSFAGIIDLLQSTQLLLCNYKDLNFVAVPYTAEELTNMEEYGELHPEKTDAEDDMHDEELNDEEALA